MFSLPARDLLHITANAVVFTHPEPAGIASLAGARFNVTGDSIDVTCTDRYALGQGRAPGTGTGPGFTAVLAVKELAPVLASLQAAGDEPVQISAADGLVAFTVSGKLHLVPVIDGPFPEPEPLFAAGPGKNTDISGLGIVPRNLALLGQLKDYRNPRTEATSQTPLTFRYAGPSRVVASLGEDFRVVFTIRQPVR